MEHASFKIKVLYNDDKNPFCDTEQVLHENKLSVEHNTSHYEQILMINRYRDDKINTQGFSLHSKSCYTTFHNQ